MPSDSAGEPTPDPPANEMLSRVLRAARKCFARRGVDRTTMVDVARAAGVSRQTLYNTVTGREELIEAVAVLRIEELAEGLAAVAGQPTVLEEIVETSVAAVQRSRDDPELRNLVETASGFRLFEIIAGPHPGVHHAVRRVFAPLFEAARRRGELRLDVSDDELVEWVRTVYLSLILRRDLDADAVRRVARAFLLPSMTCRPAPPRLSLYCRQRM